MRSLRAFVFAAALDDAIKADLARAAEARSRMTETPPSPQPEPPPEPKLVLQATEVEREPAGWGNRAARRRALRRRGLL